MVCASLPSLVSAGPPRGFDYTPRFVNHGAAILASSKGVRCRRIIPHALCYSGRRVLLFACARRDEIRDSFTNTAHCEKVSEHPARLNTCDTAGCAAGPRKTYATCSLGVRAVSGYFPQTRGDGVEVGSTHGRDGPPTGAGAQPLHSPKWLKTPYCNLRARYLPHGCQRRAGQQIKRYTPAPTAPELIPETSRHGRARAEHGAGATLEVARYGTGVGRV